MNPQLEMLHDIEGLDPISFWPLAIGWWVLIAVVILILTLTLYFGIRKLAFKRSWKNDILRKLTRLEKELSALTARETIILLSEYLRRIALRRFSRKECAGLVGQGWLKWLTNNDPKGFDWEKKGVLLIEIPYAPKNSLLPVDRIKDLIQAIREWVR
ncbi:MAG: DUF4381 domain-containing protein [Chlamydiota bacterium]